jgi:hypothetical protein
VCLWSLVQRLGGRWGWRWVYTLRPRSDLAASSARALRAAHSLGRGPRRLIRLGFLLGARPAARVALWDGLGNFGGSCNRSGDCHGIGGCRVSARIHVPQQFSTGLRTGKDYLSRQIGHTFSLLSAGQPPAKKRLTRCIVDFSAQHKRWTHAATCLHISSLIQSQ